MKGPRLLLGLAAIGAASVLGAAFLGAVPLRPGDVLRAIFGCGGDPLVGLIVREIRLPRAVLGFLVGAALGLSGGVMQGVFRNPLASPYVLGVAGGATAGVAAVVALGLQRFLPLPLGAFIGGISAAVLVYRIGRSELGLVLAGIALGALFTSFTSFILFVTAGDRRLQEIVFWTMGSLGRAGWEGIWILTPVVFLGGALLWASGRRIDALSLGEEGARCLGLDPVMTRRVLLGTAVLLTSAAVSLSGTIGFVGLVVPHMVRLISGPDHRALLPAAALTGGTFLVWADLLSRTVLAPAELPVGIVTALVGVPFFLYLLRRAGR